MKNTNIKLSKPVVSYAGYKRAYARATNHGSNCTCTVDDLRYGVETFGRLASQATTVAAYVCSQGLSDGYKAHLQSKGVAV